MRLITCIKTALSLVFLFAINLCIAQTSTINGRVVHEDSSNIPLVGASVIVKGTTIGTITNDEGIFSLNNIPAQSIIVITMTGYVNTEIQAKNININTPIKLQSSASEMADVIVTGYQTVKKRNFTGSTSTLTAKEVERAGLADATKMLEGQFAGVSFQNVSGTFGAAAKLRIRGATSLSGDNKPLWVIDGVIIEDVVNISNEALSTGDMNTLLGNSIAGVNPSDIQDITILRDAAATAMYGARAMNGVVVVTTKKGRASTKPVISYTGNLSMYLKPNYSQFDIMNSADQMAITVELLKKGYYQMPGTLSGKDGGIIYKMYNLIKAYDSTNGQYGLRNDDPAKMAFLQRYANANTNWFDVMFKNSLIQEHSVSISNGTDMFQNYASVSYLKDAGQTLGNSVERFTGNIKTNFKMGKKFIGEFLTVGSIRNQRAPGTELRVSEPVYGAYLRGFDINPYNYVLNTSRMLTPYDENGNFEYFSSNYAPFNILNEINTNYMKMGVLEYKLQGTIQYKILPQLSYKLTGAYRHVKSEQQTHILEASNKAMAYRRGLDPTTIGSNEYLYKDPDNPNDLPVSVLPEGGFYNIFGDELKSYYVRNDLEYNQKIKNNHEVGLFLSTETRSALRQNQRFEGVGYQYENGGLVSTSYKYFKKAAEQGRPYFSMQPTIDRYIAFMANGMYGYKDRYIFTPTLRIDGSNKLGRSRNARWLPTWNIAARWNISNEDFWNANKIVSSAVLRASYGLTANIGNATNSLATYYNMISRRPYFNDQETITFISDLENSELTWEKSKDLDIGTDLELFDKKLNVQFDYYLRRMHDLIGYIKTSGIGGQFYKTGNYAQMKGQGLEFTLTARAIRSDNFDWTPRFNISYNTNKIYLLKTTPSIWNGVSQEGGAVEGYPQRALFSVQFAGLNHYFGYPQFISENPGGGVTPQIDLQSDKFVNLKYEGPVDPTVTGGLYNAFRYNSFTLAALFKFAMGNKLRLRPIISGGYSDREALTRDLNNRWVYPGDELVTTIPPIIDDRTVQNIINNDGGQVSKAYPYNLYNYSTERVANGDYLKLSNVSLSYQLPAKWLFGSGLTNASLSAVANNVWVVLADKRLNGQDPEFFASGGVALPSAKQITLSIKLGF